MLNNSSFRANFSKASDASSKRVPRDVAAAVIAFVAISILAGAFGNARIFLLLCRRRHLRKVPHYLLGNLAVIGVFSSLFYMPLLIVMTIVNYFQIRDMLVAEIFCKVGFTSGYACMVVNALTLWLMAFDRDDCVVRPFNRRLTTTNVKILIGVTWIFAFTTAILIGISIRNEPSVCSAFYPYSNSIIEYGGHFEAILVVVGQFDKITILISSRFFLSHLESFSFFSRESLKFCRSTQREKTHLVDLQNLWCFSAIQNSCYNFPSDHERGTSRHKRENCPTGYLCSGVSNVCGKPNSSSSNVETQYSQATESAQDYQRG